MDKQELRALLATDPDIRNLVVRIIREDQIHNPLVTDPATGMLVVCPMPVGMITYATAADMLGVKPKYIRKLVYNGCFPGGDGLVEREGLIRHALTHCKEPIRRHLVEWLEAEQATPCTAPDKRPVREVAPTLF